MLVFPVLSLFIFWIAQWVVEVDGGSSSLKGGPGAPVIAVNTWGGPFSAATQVAYNTLTQGGSSLDAIVDGCSTCENNQCDGSVGYGNHPDTTGRTTLDALIMDGVTMDVGSVGFIGKFRNAIQLARAVMDYTTHTLLVGEGAEEFALMVGLEPQDATTNNSVKEYRNWKNQNCQPNFYQNLDGCETSCPPYPTPDKVNYGNLNRSNKVWASKEMHDTIGMIAIDQNGHMACGTSTNGATHKVRGRMGDSPIVGAGCYVDSMVGGCAATGDGDIMMRFLPTFAGVNTMRSGRSPTEAAQEALRPAIAAYPTFSGAVVCLSRDGSYGAATYNMDFEMSIMADGMSSVLIVPVPDMKNT